MIDINRNHYQPLQKHKETGSAFPIIRILNLCNMKNFSIRITGLLLLVILACSCEQTYNEMAESPVADLPVFKQKITIDSVYTYPGDSLYQLWVVKYNAGLNKKTRSLSAEDDAFFSKSYVVKSTEATLMYGKNYIYPGAILEGNIIDQKYAPVFVNNRNPITVSATLIHNTPKPTSRTIASPTFSKLNDYVKEIVVDGNFQQNQKFMFQQRRFTFYDEIKQAFGTNIDTKNLFSSKKESSTEEKIQISKSAGMYVKFFQSSFTVNMDIAPLSNQQVTGNSGFEPVYVSSLTYGRMGIIVFETDESYEFAESCIKKEFDGIFYDKTTVLTEKEELFFETTDFKVLILGADSDYSVQTVKGYSPFLNLVYNSKFDQNSYGVPIACSYSYANTHRLVEAEFESVIRIEPLYVHFARDNYSYQSDVNGYWSKEHCDRVLYFYKDRQKQNPARPTPEIIFEIYWSSASCRERDWEDEVCTDETGIRLLRNIGYDTKLKVDSEYDIYRCDGERPDENEDVDWESSRELRSLSLQENPFFIELY